MTPPLLPGLLANLRRAFASAFGAAPSHVVQAPGRVNLMGEHTDYNDGFVLPCAIGFHVLLAARPRDDARVRVLATDLGGARDEFGLDAAITPRPDAPWANYVRGVVRELLGAGWPLRGADLAIAGNVPRGAGLSSSAALEVAVVQAFKSLHDWRALGATDIARIAQRAENDFVGCRCGIMDPLISARGQAGHALLIDCRSLAVRPVRLPDGLALMIVHSNVKRGLVDSEYNLRRDQCEAAARHFGVAALRDVSAAQLASGGAGLDGSVLRRARHVVGENARTLAARDALQGADLVALGALMAASHQSMRDDFEISVPAIDQLVEILRQAIGGAGGARMTGGGFGGCVVALLPQARVAAARAAVAAQYRAPSGGPATVYICQAGPGAGPVQQAQV